VLSEEELIQQCLDGQADAQRQLYERYAPKLWPVCLRYAKNRMSAEDIMQEGFIRIYKYLGYYKGEGSFEGWLRRTMVNTAINYYKKNLKQADDRNIDFVFGLKNDSVDAISEMTAEEIVSVIQTLPDGYRTIFNMFVIEGYPHKEIAKILGISENTSKSQLSRARVILQEKLRKIYKLDDEK
jgi:RNA polymerase sigma-70 factor (ECF subfamily)